MNLKERIQELCKQKQISMNQLESDLGFGKGYISKLGKSTPNATKIQQIAKYFNTTVDFLMNGDESPVQPDLSSVNTIAAHFDGEEFSDDEWQDIVNYMNYVKSKRG